MVVEADALVAAVDGIGGVRDDPRHPGCGVPTPWASRPGGARRRPDRAGTRPLREPERRIDGKWVAATPDDGAHWRATQTPELMQSIKNQLSGGGWLGAPIAAWRAAPFVAVDDGWRLADFPGSPP